MKLLIKLYKPDGTCEEHRDESKTCTAEGCRCEELALVKQWNGAVTECLLAGGRIEIAPIVE